MSILSRWIGLTGLMWAVSTHAGQTDVLFMEGFDPCCRLGGAVAGLQGAGLSVELGAGAINEVKAVAAFGGEPRRYAFSSSVPVGTAFIVLVKTQPNGQNCTISNASGTVGSSAIDNIDIQCTDSPGLIWDQRSWDTADWQ